MRIDEVVKKDNQPSPEEIVAIIKRDCAPFLAAISNQPEDYRLWRGSNSRGVKFFSKQPCPVNRPPRDTDPRVSMIVDQWFFDKTGIRFRSNATFAVGDIHVTEQYGAPYSILPIGKFSFCWSPTVGDMTYDLLNEVGVDAEAIHGLLEDAGYVLNKDMKSAIDSGSEIMIHCPSGFYALKHEASEIHRNFDYDGHVLEKIQYPEDEDDIAT